MGPVKRIIRTMTSSPHHCDLRQRSKVMGYYLSEGEWIHLVDCPPYLTKEATFVTSCLFPYSLVTFSKEVDSEKQDFAKGANCILREWTPTSMGDKTF